MLAQEREHATRSEYGVLATSGNCWFIEQAESTVNPGRYRRLVPKLPADPVDGSLSGLR